MFSIVLFWLNHSLKPKDINFTIIYDKKKHKILTFKKLEPAKALKMTKMIIWLSK